MNLYDTFFKTFTNPVRDPELTLKTILLHISAGIGISILHSSLIKPLYSRSNQYI